jgi:hypothetical protein
MCYHKNGNWDCSCDTCKSLTIKQMSHPFSGCLLLLLLFLLLFPLLIHIAYATEQTTNPTTTTIIHGGGMASIDCPDGSSVDTDVSFVAMIFANGTIQGNWTIDTTEGTSLPTNGFNQGPIYRGNLSTGHFNIRGETYNPQEQINLCASPMFAPLFLTGQCGQNVIITIRFQSNDPLGITDSFPADVECQLI